MTISDSEGKVVYEGVKPEEALCTVERLKELIEVKQKETRSV